MEIAVLGATGRTGKRVVDDAVRRGHRVRAASRSARAEDGTAGVRWVAADVLNGQDVERLIDGADAVISAVGVGLTRQETTVYSSVATHCARITRGAPMPIAVVSAAPVGDRRKHGFTQRAVLMPVLDAFFGASYRDMARMEGEFSRHQNLCWYSLRPPYLRDASPTGTYRIGSAPLPRANSITTGDLASALLDVVQEPPASWHIGYVAN